MKKIEASIYNRRGKTFVPDELLGRYVFEAETPKQARKIAYEALLDDIAEFGQKHLYPRYRYRIELRIIK